MKSSRCCFEIEAFEQWWEERRKVGGKEKAQIQKKKNKMPQVKIVAKNFMDMVAALPAMKLDKIYDSSFICVAVLRSYILLNVLLCFFDAFCACHSIHSLCGLLSS